MPPQRNAGDAVTTPPHFARLTQPGGAAQRETRAKSAACDCMRDGTCHAYVRRGDRIMANTSKPYVIVVGVDFSESGDIALETAFQLCDERYPAELHVVNVMPAY